MTLDDLGAIGNLVSGIAVILSLLYLARQVHQANRASIAATSGAVSELFANQLLEIGRHRDLCAILIKQGQGAPLDAVERLQMNFLLRSQLIAFENYYNQHVFGYMDQAGWRSRLAIVAGVLSDPGARALWDAQLMKEQHPSFARAVNEELARRDSQRATHGAAVTH